MDALRFELEYEWEPFMVTGQHLNFAQLCKRQLFPNECSHWGTAVYKWEGLLTRGTHVGKVGILIGETENISQCIQQYATATSESADFYKHKSFLSQGDVRLFIFKVHKATLGIEEPKSIFESLLVSSPRERRIVYKELWVTNQVLEKQPHIVLMNWRS